MYEVPLEDTLHHLENSTLTGVIEYIFAGKGIIAGTVAPIAIFAHSAHLDENTAEVTSPFSSAVEGSNRPDLEIMPIAHWCSDPPPYTIRNGVFSFLVCVLQAKSVDSVRLASRDPHARPAVDFDFLSDPEGFAKFRRGMPLSLRLADNVRRQGYKMKDFQVPSSEKECDMDKFRIIRASIRTNAHYTSTCRMARRQVGGVSNDNLEVYGVRGLRVCDASVFPCITSGVVAEKCADLMKERTEIVINIVQSIAVLATECTFF